MPSIQSFFGQPVSLGSQDQIYAPQAPVGLPNSGVPVVGVSGQGSNRVVSDPVGPLGFAWGGGVGTIMGGGPDTSGKYPWGPNKPIGDSVSSPTPTPQAAGGLYQIGNPMARAALNPDDDYLPSMGYRENLSPLIPHALASGWVNYDDPTSASHPGVAVQTRADCWSPQVYLRPGIYAPPSPTVAVPVQRVDGTRGGIAGPLPWQYLDSPYPGFQMM